MSVIITIETKSGKEIKMDASEARDVYRQLGEIFNPQDYKLDELKKACEIAREKVESTKRYTIPNPPVPPTLKPIDMPIDYYPLGTPPKIMY